MSFSAKLHLIKSHITRKQLVEYALQRKNKQHLKNTIYKHHQYRSSSRTTKSRFTLFLRIGT